MRQYNQNVNVKVLTVLLVLCLLVSSNPIWAQISGETRKQVRNYSEGAWFPNILKPYATVPLAEIDFTNTDRIKRLIQDGKLSLSLSDAIALALENNLDIAASRYDLLAAQVDLMRAKSGAAPRGVTGAPIPGGLFAGAIGAGIGGGAFGTGTGGAGGAGFGGRTSARVPAGGSFDPGVHLDYNFNYNTDPLNNPLLTGLRSVTTNDHSSNLSFSQYFQTGTTYFISASGRRESSTSQNLLFNPSVVSSFSVGFNQHLLKGFGLKANAGFIRVAKNNIKISDAVFRKQVMDVVSRVIEQYWELVSRNEALKVAKHSVDLAQKLLRDNKTQVEIGTMAPIEVTRAEAEVAKNQQRYIEAETAVQQQEELIKQAITKSLDPLIRSAAIEPTDRLPEPKPEDIPDELEAIRAALAQRPDIEQTKLNLANSDIAVETSRNQLLPTLDIFGFFGGSGLSGDELLRTRIEDPLTGQIRLGPALGILPRGLSSSLGNTFRFIFPNYAIGFSLDIPIRNRSAKSNYARALIDKRQAETSFQRLRNQVTQEVRNALIGLSQSKAQVEAARKSRVLAQRTFEAEELKFRTGVSTPFLVIQAQRDLISAQADETRALSTYGRALVEMTRVTGSTLDKARISFEDAKEGEVKNPPQFSYSQ